MASDLILVTGAAGFVGRATCAQLEQAGLPFRAAVRSHHTGSNLKAADVVAIGDIGKDTDWTSALRGVRSVIHLAAHAHVAPRPDGRFQSVNVDGTRALVRAAIETGVERFVLASSLKVYGDTSGDGSFDETSPERPCDPYGRSKLDGEHALRDAAKGTSLSHVTVRFPLVYGPAVRANFLSLMRLVDTGVPLPFGALNNRRSLMFVDNLADLLRVLATTARPTSPVYVAADVTLSTPELIRALARALSVPARLLDVPPSVLRSLGAIPWFRHRIDRLIGSLAVDPRRLHSELEWDPLVSVDRAMEATATWYRSQRAR